MSTPDRVDAARRAWRVRMVVVIAGLVAAILLSFWIRAGHSNGMVAVAAFVLFAAIGLLARKTASDRAQNDPAYAATYMTMAQTLKEIHRRNRWRLIIAAAIFIALPVNWCLTRLVPPSPLWGHPSNGLTFHGGAMVLSLAIALALAVGGLALWHMKRGFRDPR